jgi:hypothetical protein
MGFQVKFSFNKCFLWERKNLVGLPGVEPESQPCEGYVIPLDHRPVNKFRAREAIKKNYMALGV